MTIDTSSAGLTASQRRRVLAATDHFACMRDRLPHLAPQPEAPEMESAETFGWRVHWASATVNGIGGHSVPRTLAATVTTYYTETDLTPLPEINFDFPDAAFDATSAVRLAVLLGQLASVANEITGAC